MTSHRGPSAGWYRKMTPGPCSRYSCTSPTCTRGHTKHWHGMSDKIIWENAAADPTGSRDEQCVASCCNAGQHRSLSQETQRAQGTVHLRDAGEAAVVQQQVACIGHQVPEGAVRRLRQRIAAGAAPPLGTAGHLWQHTIPI